MACYNIFLSRVTSWEETSPEGLDSERWKAFQAVYSTYTYFDTQTDNDCKVEGEAACTMIGDKEKSGSTPGRFLLLYWQDIDPNLKASQSMTWSDVKNLYR